ncbi:MAG: DUF1800 domain-containing protein [Planctomycetes bacterium]|nr:DUF1800 domain-containing protein [Planctomycetota bacterium]
MSDELLEPWRPTAGAWDRAAAAHLYRRAGFGATPAELERALEVGHEASLEQLFAERTEPALRASIRPLLAAGELELLQAWWMGLILAGGAPLHERMTLVWHDLFATSNDKVDDVRLMHAQNELFRTQGLGDFRALLHALARDPAMLVWLDGDSNRRGHANENFAREVLELFTLGIGNYEERDVQEAARAFSGWGTEGRASVFRAAQHDDGEKTLFAHAGRWSSDDALDLILAQPACARHVARVLLEAFVGSEVQEPWIAAVVAELVRCEWNVERVLRALLSSKLFFSPAARRARIAGPVELVAVAARALGARVAPRRAARWAAEMGQALFRPPSVKGWDGGRAWIHSGSWIARHNALVELARGGADEGEVHVDLALVLGAGAGEALAAALLERLLPDTADAELAAALRRTLRQPDLEQARIAGAALLLTTPEFQLF